MIVTNFRVPNSSLKTTAYPLFSGKPSVEEVTDFLNQNSDFFKRSAAPTKHNTQSLDAENLRTIPSLSDSKVRVDRQVQDVKDKKVGVSYLAAFSKDLEAANRRLSKYKDLCTKQGFQILEYNPSKGSLKATKELPENASYGTPELQEHRDVMYGRTKQGKLLSVWRSAMVDRSYPKSRLSQGSAGEHDTPDSPSKNPFITETQP